MIGPFGIEFPDPVDRVVPIYFEDGTKTRYAIQLADGSFWGQEWVRHSATGIQSRIYPTYKTRAGATKKFAKLGLGNAKS